MTYNHIFWLLPNIILPKGSCNKPSVIFFGLIWIVICQISILPHFLSTSGCCFSLLNFLPFISKLDPEQMLQHTSATRRYQIPMYQASQSKRNLTWLTHVYRTTKGTRNMLYSIETADRFSVKISKYIFISYLEWKRNWNSQVIMEK